MKDEHIHLGYEVAGGESISIPLGHMAVTGQTQQSGKTTALEALITRSELRAISFITKRGERGFESGRQISPYFEERADWEYVSGILESIRHEKMKFERAWIIRACKGARSLKDVQENVRKLGEETKSGMSADMYMMLGEYLSKVVPAIEALPKIGFVDLQSGLNVMNLVEYPEELQTLVIASTIKWIYEHEDGVITIIPECWKFVPQSRNTPVKIVVEKLIREGAGLGNYIWLDSQDMAGVDKLMLRAARVWLIGVQRESNEVKRSLQNIPAGMKKPKADQIAKLGLGEFYACWGERVHHVYVQPAWLDAKKAKAVAQRKEPITQRPASESAIPAADGDPAAQIAELTRAVEQLKKAIAQNGAKNARDSQAFDFDSLYDHILQRLKRDSASMVELRDVRPILELIVERPVVTVDTGTLRGRIASLIAGNWFTATTNSSKIAKELARHAWKHDPRTVANEMDALTEMGFFLKDKRGSGEVIYTLVSGMRVNVKER